MVQTFTLKGNFAVPLLGICFGIMLFNNMYNFYNVKIYGHLFTRDETASFVAIVDQVQTELDLVVTDLVNNNVSLAQDHANKAGSLIPGIIIEIAEDNQRLAGNLTRAVNQLQNVSSSSKSEQQAVTQLVNDLNERLDKAKIIRIAQVQPNTNFLDRVTKFLGGIFGGNNGEPNGDQVQNSKLDALAFAELIDGVLRNYGKAYGVDFDMTNMSNMAMIGSNGSSAGPMIMNNAVTDNNTDTKTMNMNMNMHSVNSSANSVTRHDSEINSRYSLVDIAAYQSAKELAANALEFFSSDLKHKVVNNNTIFATNLESGLSRLNHSIANKASPLEIMMIVHSEIHPNLLEAFNLQLRK